MNGLSIAIGIYIGGLSGTEIGVDEPDGIIQYEVEEGFFITENDEFFLELENY